MGRKKITTHEELNAAIQHLIEGKTVTLSAKKKSNETMLDYANEQYSEHHDVNEAARAVAREFDITFKHAVDVVYESLSIAPEPTSEHRNYFAWEVLHTVNKMIDTLLKYEDPKLSSEIRQLLALKKDTIKDLFGRSTKIDWTKQQTFVPVIGFFPEELKTLVTTDPIELEALKRELMSERKQSAYKTAELTEFQDVTDEHQEDTP